MPPGKAKDTNLHALCQLHLLVDGWPPSALRTALTERDVEVVAPVMSRWNTGSRPASLPHMLNPVLTFSPDERSAIIDDLRRPKVTRLLERGFSIDGALEEVDDARLVGPEGRAIDTWKEHYPYDELMGRKSYEQTKRQLQIELLKAQEWIAESGEKLVIAFEGRDAAGKGGAIKRFTEHLNPRSARVVALGVPTERERGEWYFQRYVLHLPTAGEIALFDRSWYNRAVVEPVMGFCSNDQHEQFLLHVPEFERMLVESGVRLVKLWFSVTPSEQLARFVVRRIDPVRQWKLSPIDVASLDRWDDYTMAKEAMFRRTHSGHAPWIVVQANDKKRARIEAMRFVLNQLPYPDKDVDLVGVPDEQIVASARTSVS